MLAARFHDSAVEVLTLPPVQVAALEHEGNAAALEDAIGRFIAWRQAEGLHPRQHPTYNILYPSLVGVSDPANAATDSAVDEDAPTAVADRATPETRLEQAVASLLDIPPETFRLDLCVTIYGHFPPNDAGLVAKVITGGRYAVLRVNGDDSAWRDGLAFLIKEWLPRSGETLRDAPVILHRVGLGSEDPTRALLVDVQLPLV